MKLFQSAKSVDPLERALLSFTFEQKNLKHHFGKPSIINLQHPKSFPRRRLIVEAWKLAHVYLSCYVSHLKRKRLETYGPGLLAPEVH